MSRFHIGDIAVIKPAPKNFHKSIWVHIGNTLAGETVKITNIIDCSLYFLKEPYIYEVESVDTNSKSFTKIFITSYYYCSEILEFKSRDNVPTIF